jgi:hypothetical protein
MAGSPANGRGAGDSAVPRTGRAAAPVPPALRSSVVAGEIRYARSGDLSLAYQVVGDAAFDLVFFPD